MEVTIENVTNVALGLTRDERVELANRLYESVGTREYSALSDDWRAEIRGRVAEIESGIVELFDGDEVMREARARLKS